LVSDAVFIEMALIPNSQMIADLVELDDQNRIIVDCSNCTNVPGIYAAGDVTSGFAEQVLIAVGEGAKAALSAYEFLLPNL
jgi:alkyl hydroperoxide reductase subunit F